VARLGLDAESVILLGGEDCNLSRIDKALDNLAEASAQIRAVVLDACAHTVASDGVLQAREAELLRAIADTLDCPIPPFIELRAA
jgi:tellurite resistance protein